MTHLSTQKARILSHPERIKNLYFVYLFVMRALHKGLCPPFAIALAHTSYSGTPLLTQMEFTTGNATEEALISSISRVICKCFKLTGQKGAIGELLVSPLVCTPNFDEHGLFDAIEKVTKLVHEAGLCSYLPQNADRSEESICQVFPQHYPDYGLCGVRAM